MKYSICQTIGVVVCAALIGACLPSDDDGELPRRDAASTPDVGSADADAAEADTSPGDVAPPAVASVTISPQNPTIDQFVVIKLEATAFDADGEELADREVSWTSSHPDIASVDEHSNVRGMEYGTATITATIDGVSGTTLVTVAGNPVDTVDVVPSQPTLRVDEQLELSVLLTDAEGGLIEDERAIEFSSSSPDVATVSSDGVVTAESEGSATVTATVEGQSGTSEVTVADVEIGRVVVTPVSVQLIRGETTQLQATVYDVEDNEVTDPLLTWESSADSVATVDAAGLVEAVGEGSATITATIGGKSDTTHIDSTFSLGALDRGGRHGCGLIRGVAYCWGDNGRGQLGRGNTAADATVDRVGGGLSFVELALGEAHSCALTSSGEAYCWGANGQGQLGDGTTVDRTTPVQVQAGHVFSTLAAGAQHTCGVDSQGASWCWGANGSGQLGDGSTAGSNVPVQVSGSGFTSLFAGDSHTCGITASKVASCWGENGRGQLGVNDTNDRHTPAGVSGGYDFASLTLGQAHTCGITTGGSTACWGANDVSQLGDGTTNDRQTPILVSSWVSFSRISAGSEHTCALAAGGQIYCWGANEQGQLGVGSTTSQSEPTEVSSTASFNDVNAGGDGTCGLDGAGQPHCWGAPSGHQSPMPPDGF